MTTVPGPAWTTADRGVAPPIHAASVAWPPQPIVNASVDRILSP